MKKWLEYFYDTSTLPEDAILSSGTTSKLLQERLIAEMERLIYYRDEIQQYYVVEHNGKKIVVVFNLLGAPSMIDTLYILAQGNTRKIHFISFAGTKQDYNIGDLFLPTGAKCLDGVTNLYVSQTDIISTDGQALDEMKQFLEARHEMYHEGLAATVPAVFHRNQTIQDALESDVRVKAYEMELSSALHFSKANGQYCTPLLVISDNSREDIPDGIQVREKSYYRIFKLIQDKITQGR